MVKGGAETMCGNTVRKITGRTGKCVLLRAVEGRTFARARHDLGLLFWRITTGKRRKKAAGDSI